LVRRSESAVSVVSCKWVVWVYGEPQGTSIVSTHYLIMTRDDRITNRRLCTCRSCSDL
jgi:hypothetical protein